MSEYGLKLPHDTADRLQSVYNTLHDICANFNSITDAHLSGPYLDLEHELISLEHKLLTIANRVTDLLDDMEKENQ